MMHTASLREGRFSPRAIALWRRVLWSLALLLLTVPWVAMRFTEEVRWDALDFLVFGAMLAVAGGLVEIAVRIRRERRFVIAVVLGVGLLFLLVWAELAVGLFH